MNRDHTATIGGSKRHSWEGVFQFDPDDDIYHEHFPGYPVVPGSLIVHAFMKAAEEIGFSTNPLTIQNFRFREFLRPGIHRFRIERKGNRLHCSIIEKERKMVTGIVSK